MQYIIPSSQAGHLGRKISRELESRGIENVKVIWTQKNNDGERYFSDEEVYTRIPEAEEGLFDGGDVTFLHAGQRKPNAGIVELDTNIECVNRYASPRNKRIFFSQYPYRRQDKEFEKGGVAKAKTLYDRFIDWYGIDEIKIIDAHFAGSKEWDLKKRPFVAVSASELMIAGIKKQFGEVLFLGPDVGAQDRFGLEGTLKERDGSYQVRISSEDELKELVRRHERIAAIDDETSTGGTMVKFKDYCRRINPGCTLIAGLVHGVKQKGIDRTKEAYDHFFLTNTVGRKEANVDVTELIMCSLGIVE